MRNAPTIGSQPNLVTASSCDYRDSLSSLFFATETVATQSRLPLKGYVIKLHFKNPNNSSFLLCPRMVRSKSEGTLQ